MVFESRQETTDMGFNQHIADKGLLYSLEVSEELD